MFCAPSIIDDPVSESFTSGIRIAAGATSTSRSVNLSRPRSAMSAAISARASLGTSCIFQLAAISFLRIEVAPISSLALRAVELTLECLNSGQFDPFEELKRRPAARRDVGELGRPRLMPDGGRRVATAED